MSKPPEPPVGATPPPSRSPGKALPLPITINGEAFFHDGDPAMPLLWFLRDKLRLTERFRKVSDTTIEWSVTFDDPVFFTEPWTVTRPLTRGKPTDRVMSYSCNENNRDIPHLKPTKPPM